MFNAKIYFHFGSDVNSGASYGSNPEPFYHFYQLGDLVGTGNVPNRSISPSSAKTEMVEIDQCSANTNYTHAFFLSLRTY